MSEELPDTAFAVSADTRTRGSRSARERKG
jgi:hypothetical protein